MLDVSGEGAELRVFQITTIPSLHPPGPPHTHTQHNQMAHALGMGSVWDASGIGCVTGCTGTSIPYDAAAPNNYYKCANAQREFNAVGGVGKLPIETRYPMGSSCFHWAEWSLGAELMTLVSALWYCLGIEGRRA